MSLFKKIILGLFLSSFIGYLEWGKQSEFIFEIEYDLLFKMSDSPEAFLHPFILLPLLGQIVLLISFWVPKPKFWIILLASTGMALLFLMLFLIGILNWNPKITLLTLPFLAAYSILITRRKSLTLENK